LLFKNNYAVAVIFLNTIIHRLPTPKKANLLDVIKILVFE